MPTPPSSLPLPPRWTVRPAESEPTKVFLLIAVLCGATYSIMISLESGWLGALTMVLLAFASAPFWLTTTYEVDHQQITQKRFGRSQTRRWSEIRRIEPWGAGFLLSPFAKPHALDRYRGLLVLVPQAQRTVMSAQLQAYVDNAHTTDLDS